MTGEDVEVVCGEWEIGKIPFSTSGEEYNLVMQIENIKRHPHYEIVRSRNGDQTQYVINDIAVIIVEAVDQRYFAKNQVYPACLPLGIFHNLSLQMSKVGK